MADSFITFTLPLPGAGYYVYYHNYCRAGDCVYTCTWVTFPYGG